MSSLNVIVYDGGKVVKSDTSELNLKCFTIYIFYFDTLCNTVFLKAHFSAVKEYFKRTLLFILHSS